MAKRNQKNRTKPHNADNNPVANLSEAKAPAGNPPTGNSAPPPASTSNSSILIKVAVVTGVFTLLAAIVAWVDPQTFTSFFLRTPVVPSVTPIPYARIQSLAVIYDGGDTDTINLGEKIFLPAGSSVLIKVNFVTSTDVENIVFHWEFCHPEKNIIGQGAIEIPYKLSGDGKDCINVKIEKDGQFLHTATFFVNTK